jgi:hypothetical protein
MGHPLSISSLYGHGREPKGSSVYTFLRQSNPLSRHDYKRMSFLFKTTSSYFINMQLLIFDR